MVMCCLETNKGELRMEMNKLLEDYGCLAFSDDVMKERIPKSIYKAFHENLGIRKWCNTFYPLVYANDWFDS